MEGLVQSGQSVYLCPDPPRSEIMATRKNAAGQITHYQMDGLWRENSDSKTLASCKVRFDNRSPLLPHELLTKAQRRVLDVICEG